MQRSAIMNLSANQATQSESHEVNLFSEAVRKYDKVYLVISPPRCSSTAFARVFWGQPSIRYYSHEPFDVIYHKNLDLSAVVDQLESSLDLQQSERKIQDKKGHALIIKEMSFQVGRYFSLLAGLAQTPIIFLVRDPRLSIASRMQKRVEGGDRPVFPVIESGWELLLTQVQYCQQQSIPYMIVDSTDFRKNPQAIFKQVFAKMKLVFKESMLSWRPDQTIEIGNLDGQQKYWYDRVMASTTIQAATESIPAINSFPEENGFRDHVLRCLDIYQFLYDSPERIADSP